MPLKINMNFLEHLLNLRQLLMLRWNENFTNDWRVFHISYDHSVSLFCSLTGAVYDWECWQLCKKGPFVLWTFKYLTNKKMKINLLLEEGEGKQLEDSGGVRMHDGGVKGLCCKRWMLHHRSCSGWLQQQSGCSFYLWFARENVYGDGDENLGQNREDAEMTFSN